MIFCGLLIASTLLGCKKKAPEQTWLSGRGRVLRLIAAEGNNETGTTWLKSTDSPTVFDAVDANDPKALLIAMKASRIDALLVGLNKNKTETHAGTLRQRFANAEWVAGFEGLAIVGDEFLLRPRADESGLPESAGKLGRMARLVLGGEKPPPAASFPANLRRTRRTEVAVVLREAGELRLWRSARAQSISKAVTLAAQAARDRWSEKESQMGGTLNARLAAMTVEVWEFIDDGTLELKDDRLLERMLSEAHGFGYERPGRWRYLLPEQVAGFGSRAEALRSLFVSNGLPVQSAAREDLRLYRFVTRPLSISRP